MSEKTDEDAVEEEFKDDSEYGFKPDESQEKRGLWRKGLTKEGSQLGFTSQHKTLNEDNWAVKTNLCVNGNIAFFHLRISSI